MRRPVLTMADAAHDRVSLAELARRAKVSTATISRVINRHPAIAPKTRERIERLIAETGYVPDRNLQRFFRHLHRGTRTVAFLATDYIFQHAQSRDGFYSRAMDAIHGALRKKDYFMVYAVPGRDLLPDGRLHCVADHMVEAVITEYTDVAVLRATAAQVPVVLFNTEQDVPGADVVLPDVERAVRAELNHLEELGHRCVACFAPHSGSWQERRYIGVFAAECRHRGWPLPDECLQPARFEDGRHAAVVAAFLDRVLAAPVPPTAVLTYDCYAPDFMRELSARGRRVPEEFSLIGFDDVPNLYPTPVPLTTYRQDFEAMANAAVQLVLDRLKNPRERGMTLAIEGNLVVRSSTAPAPAAASS